MLFLVTVTATAVSAKAIKSGFSADPTTGPAPLTVDFTSKAKSDYTITDYAWDFGDGSPILHSSGKEVEHTYQDEGQYQVTLEVTNDQGSKSTYTSKPGYINVINTDEPETGLTVDFTTVPRTGTSGDEPLTVKFKDRSVSTSKIIDWEWEFNSGDLTDDNAARGNPEPSVTYKSKGTYTVSLTVWDEDGNKATEVKRNYIRVR